MKTFEVIIASILFASAVLGLLKAFIELKIILLRIRRG